jgi:hypothetical protein
MARLSNLTQLCFPSICLLPVVEMIVTILYSPSGGWTFITRRVMVFRPSRIALTIGAKNRIGRSIISLPPHFFHTMHTI